MINYDTEKIDRLLKDFFNATGINMDFYSEDFRSVSGSTNRENIGYCKCIHATTEGNRRCISSDAELLRRCKETKTYRMHICHAGLTDVAVPIIHEGNIMGYVIFGQIRTDCDFSGVEEYVVSLGLDKEGMEELYQSIPVFDGGRIESILNIATVLAKHIMLENMLRPDYDKVLESAVNYIANNLERPLSVSLIARNTNSSKTVLYQRFRQAFDCTVSEYINSRRVERSAELLRSTDMSVEEIAQRTGFSGTSYYCKIFKKQMGISPFRYRRAEK